MVQKEAVLWGQINVLGDQQSKGWQHLIFTCQTHGVVGSRLLIQLNSKWHQSFIPVQVKQGYRRHHLEYIKTNKKDHAFSRIIKLFTINITNTLLYATWSLSPLVVFCNSWRLKLLPWWQNRRRTAAYLGLEIPGYHLSKLVPAFCLSLENLVKFEMVMQWNR